MYYKEHNIVQWAYEKGIIESGDRLTQSLKTMEEIAELISHALKAQDCSDDLGDIYVTIVVQAHMSGFCIQEIHDNPANFEYRDSIKEQIADMMLDACMMADSIQNERTTAHWISNIYNGLIRIADSLDLSLPRCIDLAYDEISGRKGKMIDGVFVKEE